MTMLSPGLICSETIRRDTDYYDYSIARTVILGFSKHTRNLFSEMRKHAANFEGTAYLVEYNADYEHRENYSMGGRHVSGQEQVQRLDG